jgi:hypothetical protein
MRVGSDFPLRLGLTTPGVGLAEKLPGFSG